MYVGLKNLLDKEILNQYRDYSVPKDDPIHIYAKTNERYRKELEDKLRNQMIHASVIIILAGVYASYSESIQMEIKLARELDKPILAVEYWGSERTSLVVKSNADMTVKWNSTSIFQAIKTLVGRR